MCSKVCRICRDSLRADFGIGTLGTGYPSRSIQLDWEFVDYLSKQPGPWGLLYSVKFETVGHICV